MATKTTGAELKTFWELSEPWWLKDGWVEGDSYVVNGQEMDDCFDPSCCEDQDVIVIHSGVIVDQLGEKELDLQTQFRKWRKSLTSRIYSVEIPIEAEQELKAAIKVLKGRVL